MKKGKFKLLVAALGATAVFLSPFATAQSSGNLPSPDPLFKGKIGRTADVSTPDFPRRPEPPKGAPNILLVLLDDVGYAQFGTFGGAIPTPELDRLAARGLRYTNFNTTALCSPTRAALLTGRNPHVAGTGVIQELGTGFPGYSGIIPVSVGSISQVLNMHGYATGFFGKDHNIPDWEASAAGPFDQWPTRRGFDYFFGFIGGETNQWAPNLWEGTRPYVLKASEEGEHLTTMLVDHTVDWIREQKAIAPKRPFFAYVAPGATHAPHHAPPEWIAS